MHPYNLIIHKQGEKMKYNWKLFKLDQSNRIELTKYLTIPIFLELRVNGQLKTGEVILDAVPVSEYGTPFQPKTKFILERWTAGQLEVSYDFCVDHDDVERYPGAPEYCCHRIHLIDAAVVAQGMHCDNFSLTYELNDVTLNYKTVISDSEKAVVIKQPDIAGAGYKRPNWEYGSRYAIAGIVAWYKMGNGDFVERYTNSFSYRWTGLDAISNLSYNNNALISHEISFTMPIVECYANGESAVPTKLFNCPTRCRVTRTTLKNGQPLSGTTVQVLSRLYNPTGVQNRNDRIMYNTGSRAGLRTTNDVNFSERSGGYSDPYAVKIFRESEISNFPAMINLNNTSNSSRSVTFKTTELTSQQLAEQISYRYDVTLQIEPYESGAFVKQYTKEVNVKYVPPPIPIIFTSSQSYVVRTINLDTPPASSCRASVSFICRNMHEPAPPMPFLIKGRPYNCYELFRKAMLTVDTQIIDNEAIGLDEQSNGIQYPVVVHDDWIQKLKDTTMFESVFEGKNLWEIIIQIGYYLHAVPHFEFAKDGTDRFVLNFTQLGGTGTKNNESTKLTVFNSQTLDNFFAQYDSYVTNLFSPQNEIDEWIVCKTSDSSYLVNNNTAELHTKYNITELVQFDIIYNGRSESALEYVFEKSVYNVLSPKTDFIPAKWSALFYELGTNKIMGLNYVPSTPSNDGYMALKTIVGKIFNNGVTIWDLKFNELAFHIRYKTQDSMRITQLRPDLERFMKNSTYEKYPHHEQYYGQEDKIVDSERFSANLWGKLIRVANGVYQCQEYVGVGDEKEPGFLTEIYGDNYYITECENEYYPDAIFQKVTYSKNFNQLAQIVTIPSEPRFYEVSERSLTRREVRLLDFIVLTTDGKRARTPHKYINPNKWHELIRNLLFCDNGNAQLPNFAYTNFKGDVHRLHYKLENNDKNILFPKSDAKLIEGVYQPEPSQPNTAVIVPLLHSPLRNALILEWDMDDNFKAGDCRDVSTIGNTEGTPTESNPMTDGAYEALQPVRYCDTYGRADLFDFKLFYKDDWSEAQSKRLPFAEESDFRPNAEDSIVLIPDNLSVGLDKDNREALSFNYQLNLLHAPHEDDTEDFITFANLFGKKKSRLKVALLKTLISPISQTVRIDASTIVTDEITYSFDNIENGLKINFELLETVSMDDVKSIVMYDVDGVSYAYIAKNVAKLNNTDKLQSWYICSAYNEN